MMMLSDPSPWPNFVSAVSITLFWMFQGKFLTLTGVSSDATRLSFTADGRFLVLTDCRTRSVLQYRVAV
jgi:hypothetical protein